MARRIPRHEILVALGLIAAGVGAWLHWTITDPTFEASPTQSEWPYLLAFSGLIASLAVAATALARTIAPVRRVRTITSILLGAALVGAVTNIVEDGFGVEDAFLVFALSTGVQLLSLLALAVALAMYVAGTRRVLALAPLGTAIGVVGYVNAGGPILLATWCGAAFVLVLTGLRTAPNNVA